MSRPFYIPKRFNLTEIQNSLQSIARLIGVVSVTDLPTMTLAQLNSKITDATLDDITGTRTPKTHAVSHIPGGADDLMSRFMVMDGNGLMANEEGVFIQME